MRLDAIATPHFFKQNAMLLEQSLTLRNLSRCDPKVKIAGEGLHKLRLTVVQLKHSFERLDGIEGEQCGVGNASVARFSAQPI